MAVEVFWTGFSNEKWVIDELSNAKGFEKTGAVTEISRMPDRANQAA